MESKIPISHNDYVWIDGRGSIWRVVARGKEEWLYYWNGYSICWVPLRPTRYPNDLWMESMPHLPRDEAELYSLLSKIHGGPG